VDGSGVVYVADYGNHTIRKISTGGVVSTLAGFAGNFGSADGTGTNAQFYQPEAIVVDSSGFVYVADTANQSIRKITSAGAVSTLAGLAGNFGSADGTGTNAQFYSPQGVAVDRNGILYVADSANNTLRKVTAAGVVSTLAGLAGSSGSADGTNNHARFWSPIGVAITGTNSPTLYVADSLNSTIRRVAASGTNWVVTTLAGSASTGSADGPPDTARFNSPQSVAVDNAGNVYVADSQNSTLRKFTPSGIVSTVAGAPNNAGSADGIGTNAQFNELQGIAVDASGTLYVADTANNTIRRISAAGVVSTLAGVAGNPGSADATGTNAQFWHPEGVAVDTFGNVYVADSWNCTIRQVTPSGVVSTLAGVPASPGTTDGTNSSALFNWPVGVALDNSGNLFVSDSFNHTIRQLSLSGTNWVVTTVAGLGGSWGNADGTNSDARFYFPQGLVADSAGDLYVLDSGNCLVRKLTPSGANWVVSTVAGKANVSGSANGTGPNALFNFAAGIAKNNSGALYLVDGGNNLLRPAWLITNNAPTIITPPLSQAAPRGATVTFSVSAVGTAPIQYQWRFSNTNLPNATNTTLTLNDVNPSTAGAYSIVVSNTYGTAATNATLTVQPFVLDAPFAHAPFGTNGLRLQAEGVLANQYLTLYASTDLIHWLPVLTNAPAAGSVQMVDTNAAAFPSRFYRAAEQ
jgi:sugar lactone lactonase YvrE